MFWFAFVAALFDQVPLKVSKLVDGSIYGIHTYREKLLNQIQLYSIVKLFGKLRLAPYSLSIGKGSRLGQRYDLQNTTLTFYFLKKYL